MCITMTTGMERPTSITTITPPPNVNLYDDVEGGQQQGDGDVVMYQDDEYVQLALFSLMKNLCSVDECQTPETPSIPSTPIDVTDAFQYKLDQAADSVKHHLLYAVREEVDALRGKVSDLERKIYRLEKENTLLLREYVPPEILEQMRGGRTATTTDVMMTDRYMKKFRPSSAAAVVQKQQNNITTAAGNCKNSTANLSVSIRANNTATNSSTATTTITDKTHLINGAVQQVGNSSAPLG